MDCKSLTDKIKNYFSSIYFIPVFIFISIILYFLRATSVTVGFYCFFVVAVLLFCDDVKSIFMPVFYVSFAISDIERHPNWIFYIVCISIAVLTFIYFIFKNIIISKGKVKKGKMFYPLLIADVGFLLAGVIGFFDITVFLITLGLSVASLFLYLIALNCTSNLKEYLYHLFLYIAISICLQALMDFIFFNGDFELNLRIIGAQNVNVASIFILLGMEGCFGIGVSKDYDFLMLILAGILYSFILIFLNCRMAILLGFLFLIFMFIVMTKNSDNKMMFCYVLSFFSLVIIALLVFCWGVVEEAYNTVIEKEFSIFESRGDLWKFYLEKFTSSPFFGIGFICKEGKYVYNMNLVLAHNTVVQWITSLGVVGCILMAIFYFYKYKTLFSGHKENKLVLILIILIIELSGITDQAASMDIFIHVITLVILACAENSEENVKKKGNENDRK